MASSPSQSSHLEKEKPQKRKSGVEVAESMATPEAQPEEARSAPHHSKLVEAWRPKSETLKAGEKKAKEELEQEEKAAEQSPSADKNRTGFLKPALNSPKLPLQAQKKVNDGFELAQTQQTGSLRAHLPVTGTHPVPAEGAPKAARPPDAFSVLHAAQEPGVYFQEEGHHGPAEQADPDLSAAIEEAIRLLFGVRGILRVSGGFNKENQPAIIVVATQGFGEASMKRIPPKVHRFETILAVPYDLLPLKREQL